MSLNILEVRANSGIYRVLLKLLGICVAAGCQGYSVLLAYLYLGFECVGFGPHPHWKQHATRDMKKWVLSYLCA